MILDSRVEGLDSRWQSQMPTGGRRECAGSARELSETKYVGALADLGLPWHCRGV